MRQLSLVDRLIEQIDTALRTVVAPAPEPTSEYPAARASDSIEWTESARKHAAGLMRINHTGEICAQALYFGQSMFARSEEIRGHLLEAAAEEGDHLSWCAQRLDELSDRPSRLNAIWYFGAFSLGACAAALGDSVSLGFVFETERQVESHLHDHLEALPVGDERSRAIVRQMAEDEARHGQEALDKGGQKMPQGIQQAMAMAADFMKLVVYRV